MLKIAVIGAGKGGSALLDMFHTNGNVEIVGVTDKDRNAPGLNLAKEWGIFVAEDIKELYGHKPDIVVNVTGKPEISKFIRDTFPYPIEVLEGMGSKLLWEFVSRQQKSKKDMEILYRNVVLVTGAKTLKLVLDEVLRSATELTETPAGSIVLVEGEELIMAAQRGFGEEISERIRWKPTGEGITHHILKQREPVEFHDIDKNAIFNDTAMLKEGIKSILASPLLLGGVVTGILYLDDFKPREFTERHKNLISLFSGFVAQAIQKHKLIHDLELSLAYLQGTLDDSQDMIITTDSEGRLVKFSKGGERILGYRLDEVVGKKVSEFYLDKEERSNILNTIKKKGAIHNYETTLLKKDGSPVDISLTMSELRDKAGNVIGTVGISKDVTEEKRLREELKKKNKELEELTLNLENKVLERTKELERINRDLCRANELKGRFIANASHELRTPLHSIIGFSEILLQKTFGDLNEKQQRYTNTIYTSGKHLLHLVNNILDLAKIESGKAELAYETFPLKNTVNEALMVLRPLAEKKLIELKLDLGREVDSFTADKIKFKQILYNLLSNAIKFTAEGGKIGVNIEKIRGNKDILPWASEGQKLLKVSVWDTGTGIKPEDREKIFEEFEQLDPSKATEGTGLGLSLTKKLVELHGGQIEVGGTYGKGAIFNIYLPFVIQEEMSEAKEPKPLPITTPYIMKDGALVLVVEDDVPTTEILTIHLTHAGYRVAHAYDGEEAIRKAIELKPFIITLDVTLPKKDGWEVLQSLKSNPETSDIPIIMHSIGENKELAFALGATDYLVKPVDKTVLLNKLIELSLTTKKARIPVNIMVVTNDNTVRDNIYKNLANEGFIVQSASNLKDGLNLALANRPNIVIIDLNIKEGGFKCINELRKNDALKNIPIFAIASDTISADDRLRLSCQIDKILNKNILGTNELLKHLNNIELLHPRRAGLIDELTGIFNYRYLQIRLAQEINRATRYNMLLALMILDVDHFSNYVNKKGENYGNIVLKKVSDLLSKNIRGSDILVRHGADSFALILTNTLLSPATKLAKRFVAMIHDYPFLHENVQPKGRITVSIGISEFAGQSLEELIISAESSLSCAITKGGNRVEVYQKT